MSTQELAGVVVRAPNNATTINTQNAEVVVGAVGPRAARASD